MTLSSYLSFVAATVILMAIPGPNVAAVVAASISNGTSAGLRVVLGTASAMVLQLTLVCVGLSSLLAVAGGAFEILRWLGVAYLASLGVRLLLWPGRLATPAEGRRERSDRALVLRGFLVSLTNPKTLLFYGAFFPQFLPAADASGDHSSIAVLTLAVTFLGLAIAMDSIWALLAGWLRPMVREESRVTDRVAGTILLGGALALSITRAK